MVKKTISLNLTARGFNDMMLNEIADIHSMQKVIIETFALIMTNEEISYDKRLADLHSRRLQYFNEFMAKTLNEYETEE
jgi:hypothetical protein